MGSWLLQMTRPEGHPSDGLLRDLASKRLRGEVRMVVIDHLGHCPECQRRCTQMTLNLRTPAQEAA